ncbi:hypothetical protein KIPB_009426 [Kipferlia bialata]|uniref:Uncharacterized protein n=1 Tax=Kipferlia bialata TaxID=797122 RepID=A0A9K3D1M8_9EUKA|nr:hypothetical protein KIPB_009426 [Kipferlia bialata]|eukprot:g9426.t1
MVTGAIKTAETGEYASLAELIKGLDEEGPMHALAVALTNSGGDKISFPKDYFSGRPSGPAIGDAGAIMLAAALPHLPRLTQLNLGGQEIGNEGACALAAALHHCPALQKLDMYDNSISDEGVRALVKALQGLRNVRKVEFNCNCISLDGLDELRSALSSMGL